MSKGFQPKAAATEQQQQIERQQQLAAARLNREAHGLWQRARKPLPSGPRPLGAAGFAPEPGHDLSPSNAAEQELRHWQQLHGLTESWWSVEALGSMGRQRRAGLQRRRDALLADLALWVKWHRGDASARLLVVDHKSFCRPPCPELEALGLREIGWFTPDAVGSNRWRGFEAIALIGVPWRNVNAAWSEFIALTDWSADCDDPLPQDNAAALAELQRRFDLQESQRAGAATLQAIGRLRRADATVISIAGPIEQCGDERFAGEREGGLWRGVLSFDHLAWAAKEHGPTFGGTGSSALEAERLTTAARLDEEAAARDEKRQAEHKARNDEAWREVADCLVALYLEHAPRFGAAEGKPLTTDRQRAFWSNFTVAAVQTRTGIPLKSLERKLRSWAATLSAKAEKEFDAGAKTQLPICIQLCIIHALANQGVMADWRRMTTEQTATYLQPDGMTRLLTSTGDAA